MSAATIRGERVAEILDETARLIGERGWAQRAWESDDGCLCATAAVYVACGRDPTGKRASGHSDKQYRRQVVEYQAAHWHLAAHIGRGRGRLVRQASPCDVRGILIKWNDGMRQDASNVKRTMGEVAARLRAAA